MTRPDLSPSSSSAQAASVAPKVPPPDLPLRAAPPPVTRLRASVVRGAVVGGSVLVAGALAWAFVIQPELREGARNRAVEARAGDGAGVVRPAEAVTDQPARYDRLPAPRGLAADDADPAPTGRVATRNPGPRARPGPEPDVRPEDLAARSALFFGTGGPGAPPADPGAGPPLRSSAGRGDRDGMYNGHVLSAPLSPFELKAGAVIPAVLLTGVDTERPGPVVAAVTQNVFDSVSGRHLVLPQGARLIGRHEGDSAYGDRRAVLVWERLILPNGKSLLLDGEPGVDAEGAVGVRGQVDRRLLPLLIGTLFAGAITTLGQAARDGEGGSRGWAADAGNAAAIEGAQVGGRLIDRELQVRPSIRLRPGASVRVLITRDLILEPYQP